MNPYKIQNRTDTNRRIKLVKNDGTITFTSSPPSSYIENSRQAGFCLTAISPLPPRENATNTITLTSHPMGTDGRVSLFINDTLIESKRFLNMSRITDRQAWFNSEFGAYATYSGNEFATFTTANGSPDTYRFVFEDDDIDFVFADTANAPGDVNPTLIVEQYRLAFNIMNNKIEISCDGALNRAGVIEVDGSDSVEIVIPDGTPLQFTNMTEAIIYLRTMGFVVDEILDPPKAQISCDGALSQTELYLNGLWDVEIDGEVLGSDLTKEEVFRLINPFQNDL